MRNIGTMAKVFIIVAAMTILLAVISIAGYRTAGDITYAMQDMFENYAKPAMWITDVKALAIQNRRMFGRTVYNLDDAEMRIVERTTEENRVKIAQYFADYEKTLTAAGSTKEKQLYQEVSKIRADVLKLQDEALQAGQSKDPLRIQAIIERMGVDGDITQAEGALVGKLDELATFVSQAAEDVQNQSVRDARNAQRLILIISLVSVLLGVALAVLISRQITVPLHNIQTTITHFADGDLRVQFDTKGRDEVSAMSRNLQEMSGVLGGVIGQVNVASRDISESAHDFSAMAEETNASVEEFRSNVEEMGVNLDQLAAASEEVNASVEEVAAGAQATAEKGTDIARRVEEAMTAGNKGIEAVRNVVTGIGKVAESSTTATNAVTSLGDTARQIQGFVAQIGGIADQTNLLALNAAIEAARAGDAGRGFAVVAEEVRKLAEDSNVAAQNIAKLATGITGEIDTIVALSQENVSSSNTAKDLSNDTENAITDMVEHLRGIAASTQDLAAVAEEQAASSEEIAEAVQGMATKIGSTAEAGENIRSGIAEVAAASERVASNAEGLSKLSGDLMQQLAFFKMEESAASLKESGLKALAPARTRKS